MLVPAVFQLFDCDYTLYKTDNGQLRSALCSGKPPQTRKVGALHDTKLQNIWGYTVTRLDQEAVNAYLSWTFDDDCTIRK